MGGWGVNILWYDISHLVKFDETILEDCVYAVMINKTIKRYITSFLFKVSKGGGSKYYRVGGQNITVIFCPAGQYIMGVKIFSHTGIEGFLIAFYV